MTLKWIKWFDDALWCLMLHFDWKSDSDIDTFHMDRAALLMRYMYLLPEVSLLHYGMIKYKSFQYFVFVLEKQSREEVYKSCYLLKDCSTHFLVCIGKQYHTHVYMHPLYEVYNIILTPINPSFVWSIQNNTHVYMHPLYEVYKTIQYSRLYFHPLYEVYKTIQYSRLYASFVWSIQYNTHAYKSILCMKYTKQYSRLYASFVWSIQYNTHVYMHPLYEVYKTILTSICILCMKYTI